LKGIAPYAPATVAKNVIRIVIISEYTVGLIAVGLMLKNQSQSRVVLIQL